MTRKRRRRLGDTNIRDLDTAMKRSVFKCMKPGEFKTKVEQKSCVQGVFDFMAFAYRKYEGLFSTGDEVNNTYWASLRLCRKRFGRPGTRLMDACDIGAHAVAMDLKKAGGV